jgi:hypothetical protein
MAAQQVETAANRAEHAQGEDIHLEQADRVEIVLVPLDDGALGHRGVFHRHQMVQRLLGNHETAGMLGQVPGKPISCPVRLSTRRNTGLSGSKPPSRRRSTAAPDRSSGRSSRPGR